MRTYQQVHTQGESPKITVTNFDLDEKAWQSVRIKLGELEISIIGEAQQNLAGDISNALIEGLLNIQQG